ncbi:MAG TPA: urease accessory protein UreD [Povalibacter sp.]|uniref:urease accessory protein UreD n=1 Tax=Povalibacter sp. TaxID=1962978 RepID=UPI002C8BE323|nr:urease accessory protein UreD [Povalibacter sp.]HMN46449.1 urease accessory protein UreD [Povalibacter sp.]
MNSVPAQAGHETGWRAQLRLQFAARDGRTFLPVRRHQGPLLVQRVFHPEGGPCHAYIVHPPGGIVGGDELQLDIDVEQGAHALLTTPAATKFYRSDSRFAHQLQALTLRQSTLEWLPQETIFYRGAHVASETRIDLDRQSRFIGWEIPCLGLPARGEAFEHGQLRLNLELWCEGVPLVIDRMRLDGEGDARLARWGLNGFEAVGTLLAYPADRAAVELARSVNSSEVELAVTLVDGVLICRAVAAQAEPVKTLFIELWRRLRPHLLGRPAALPRIWAT